MNLNEPSFWGFPYQSEEDRRTTKFLELLLQYGYIWKPKDSRNFTLNLQETEKMRFLNDMDDFLLDSLPFYELDAGIRIGEIKSYFDGLLSSGKKENQLKYPWYFLAYKLFQGTRIDYARDISVQEFKKSELVNRYNHLIDADLVIISNRNLNLKQIHKEFLEFSSFINQGKKKAHFNVFLIPVFQHLYLLVHSNCGKSDAERFIKYFEHLRIPSQVIDSLVKCRTSKELQDLITRQARIRVKLSSNAYHILMDWFREQFAKSSEMFVILRVLHENFHVDIFQDKDDQEFSALEMDVLQFIEEFSADYRAWNAKKKSGGKALTKTCKVPQSPDVSQMMSNLKIGAEMPETPKPSESNVGAIDFELKSSMFKMRDTAKKYVEAIKNSDMDEAQKIKALSSPDFTAPVSSETDDHAKTDQNKSGGEASTETSPGPQSDVDQILQKLKDTTLEPGEETAENQEDKTSEKVETQDNWKRTFRKSYKTNFHSVYPITISGKDVVCSSDVSPDLSYIACGFESCKICTWCLTGNDFKLKQIGTLKGHTAIVYSVSIDSNLKRLVSGSHDCTIKIWDIEKSELIYEILEHSGPVYDVCVSPNSRYFLSASADRHIKLFWYDNVYPVRVFAGHSLRAINCVRFHPNCAYFACASNDGNLFLFKINDDNRPVRMFTRHEVEVYTLSFSPCGKHLASADVNGILIVWDILKCTPIIHYNAGKGIRNISYDTSGSLIAALFYFTSWKVYNVNDAEDGLRAIVQATTAGVPKSVHFSSDNKMVVIQYIEDDEKEIEKTKIIHKSDIKVVG